MARREKMKIYHGLPKSPQDSNTLFYTNFYDGKINSSANKVKPMPCGVGVPMGNLATQTIYNISSEVTIDFWVNAEKLLSTSGSWFALLEGYDTSSQKIFGVIHDQYSLFVTFPGFVWDNSFKLTLNENYHFRVILAKNRISIYVNGKLKWERTSVTFDVKEAVTWKLFNGGHPESSSLVYISDIHFSNIDRGDYFPNLPQDFIDGKAVIKPRMGQQQIKGDPMYSQVTDLKVEAFTGVEYPTLVDNNYYRHRYNPELSVKGANNWNAGSAFRIKGLNGEIISGIVDTDTALCRIEKCVSKYSFIVNDVSKLVEGDLFKIMTTHFNDYDINVRTITNIDPLTKTITFSGNEINESAIADSWNILVEVTASSSSPTVKTKEGTNVVGTWSGLGTNEATFTLGDNSNIVGKDLYVQYALTMPYGNSDFPELPYSIEKAWGENGVEMKPVSEILIQDDFKGKIDGRTKECPHYASFTATSQLVSPQSFTKDNYIDYNHLYNLDSKYLAVSNSATSGNIGQVLLAFDLITMVETKLGKEIPSRDKVEWLRNNISQISLKTYATGSGVSGNLVNIKVRNNANTDWVGSVSSSQTSFNLIDFTWRMSEGATGNICSDGFCYFLIYAPTTNGVTPSMIRIDYTRLDIKLKTDSTYVTLYCGNTRAREDVCNPVLIQKETKTVKRYLPSKEIFSTEGTYVNPTRINVELGDKYVVKDETYLTTLGSGDYLVHQNVRFKNCINKLGLGIKAYQYDNTPLGKTTVGSYTDLYTIRELSQPYPPDNLMYPPKNVPNVSCLTMTPYLLNVDGELTLGLLALELDATGSRKASYITGYKIPYRPLIK